MFKKINTRELSATILGFVENLLEEKDITIPSDDRMGSDEEARLFGEEYYNLEDKITAYLYEKLKPDDDTAEVLTVMAHDINWDTDDDDDESEDDCDTTSNELPSNVIIPSETIHDILSEGISDYLTDEYGFCHNGFGIMIYTTQKEN